jgi:hypothetical protein
VFHLLRDGHRLVDKIKAIAKVVNERWNQETKERNARSKEALLQRASQTPFEELNKHQSQLHTNHEEWVARLNNVISQTRSTQTSIIRRSPTPYTQWADVSASMEESSISSAVSIGCDVENSSQGVAVVSSQAQFDDMTQNFSQPSSMPTSPMGKPHYNPSSVPKKRARCAMEPSVQRTVER